MKTIKFRDPKYVGDPINAIKIFNEKEVDELIFLDITATAEKRCIDLKMVSSFTDECFMPLAVGGGIRNIEEIRDILKIGAEKVCINTCAVENPDFIKKASNTFGSQSIIVSLDVKKNGSYEVFTHGGTRSTGVDPLTLAVKMEKMGAGELFLNSIDRDGTMEGYDTQLVKSVSDAVNIPVIACGGAGKTDDFRDAIEEGHASAAAAGSFFVFHGKKRAVLISYPDKNDIKDIVEA